MNTAVAISVIIPVYNVEPYLRRCIDSVVNQTLKEIEIICIDDASPDRSALILEEYARKDKRIKIITFEQNRGVAVARNTGIEEAKGEYIGFVDSDDYLDLDFCEKLYAHAKTTGVEVVKAKVKINLLNTAGFTTGYATEIKLSNNKNVFAGLFFGAIYKRTLITKNNILFLAGFVYGEDRLFPLAASYLANKVETVDDACYFYIRRENSADTHLLSWKQIENYFLAIKEIFEFLNKNVDSESDYRILASRLVLEAAYLFNRIEQEETITELLITNILEMKNIFKNEYRQVVEEDSGIRCIFQYLQTSKLEEALKKDMTIIYKKALMEQLRHNAIKI